MHINITAELFSKVYSYNFTGVEVAVLLLMTFGFIFLIKIFWEKFNSSKVVKTKLLWGGTFLGSYLLFAIAIKILGH